MTIRRDAGSTGEHDQGWEAGRRRGGPRVRALLKKSDVEKTPLDLGQVIRDVLPLVQPELTTHRIVLRTSLSDGLPPVLGDRIHLQQVVLNLMTNSIEAMRDVADRSRELMVSAQRQEGAQALVCWSP